MVIVVDSSSAARRAANDINGYPLRFSIVDLASEQRCGSGGSGRPFQHLTGDAQAVDPVQTAAPLQPANLLNSMPSCLKSYFSVVAQSSKHFFQNLSIAWWDLKKVGPSFGAHIFVLPDTDGSVGQWGCHGESSAKATVNLLV